MDPNIKASLDQFAFLKALEDLLKGPDKRIADKGKPVSAAEAQPCLDVFTTLMEQQASHDTVFYQFKLGRTKSVSFTATDLFQWISDMVTLGSSVVNNIRVKFAIYTQDYAHTHSSDLGSSASERLTVFLCPYLGDNQAIDHSGDFLPVFNLGGLDP